MGTQPVLVLMFLYHGEINRLGLKRLLAVCWCGREQLCRFWLKRSAAKFLRSIGWLRFGEAGWFCPLCDRRKRIEKKLPEYLCKKSS